MKRIYLFLLTAMLACLFVLPVSASESGSYTIDGVWYFESTYRNKNSMFGTHYVNFVSNGESFRGFFMPSSSNTELGYKYKTGSDKVTVFDNDWILSEYRTVDFGATPQSVSNDVYNFITDNAVRIGDSVVPECDGSVCPANDSDHNNICDDCGLVLTMSLRSTLLDFAKNRAENFADNYPYYAVVGFTNRDDQYNVYISKSKMTATVSNPDVVYGEDLMAFTVMTNTDGTFGFTNNYAYENWSGDLVYSNHVIANFQTLPVVIQGVTGEALEVTLPNLMTEVKTIVVLAVGCLALLILSVVLVKVLRRFSRS